MASVPYCPGCGAQREGWDAEGHAITPEPDTATTTTASGELVADDEPAPLVAWDAWIELPLRAGTRRVWVCPDCATIEEARRDDRLCVRCGRENEEEVWYVDDTVCPACTTHDERRIGDLAGIELAADALAADLYRREHDPEYCLALVASTVAVANQRGGLTNKAHWLDPLDPLADDGEPWDLVPDDLKLELVRCDEGIRHRDVWAVPNPGRNLAMTDEELAEHIPRPDWAFVERIERTLRNYVREARYGQFRREHPEAHSAHDDEPGES